MFLSFNRFSVLAVSAAIASSTLSLFAQDEDDEEQAAYELDDFVVEVKQFSDVDGFSTISADFIDETELQRIVQATLGETLSWQPGVSSSYFGPGASRPVIRGLEGFRVRILQDDIGTLDISESSPDHGVALEPLLIREIEVHRGPSALLFGNSAIGGAVNAKSRNILDELPSAPITGSLEQRFESVSDGKSVAGYTHLTLEELVITLMGAARNFDDYDIPGRARTEEYDASFPIPPSFDFPDSNNGDTITAPIPNPSGTLPNTFSQSENWSAGLSWLPEKLPISLGGAYSRFDSEYGIPYQYSGDTAGFFGLSSLTLQHERYDLDVRIELGLPLLKALHYHLGYADYNHVEHVTGQGPRDGGRAFEDAIFDQHAFEDRLEWFYQPVDFWEGVIGGQGQWQDFRVSYLQSFFDAEPLRITRYLETDNLGFFMLNKFTLGEFMFQIGSRYETQTIERPVFLQIGGQSILVDVQKADDKSFSHAGSLTWRRENVWFFDELAATPAVSLVKRIPTATERFAFWDNPAINRFVEGGDLDGTPLNVEESFGLEIGFEARVKNWSGNLSVYRYDYDNFIFLQDIKGIGNRARYEEREALFEGYECELSCVHQLPLEDSELKIALMSDYVRGQNETNDDPLPRMTPMRIGTRLECKCQKLNAGLEYRYVFDQDRVQPGVSEARPDLEGVQPELETDGYEELNFDVDYDLYLGETTLTAFLRATNLLDEERRIHTSFIKDVAPLPGRNFSLGFRASF